jgi:hypothetical protein
MAEPLKHSNKLAAKSPGLSSVEKASTAGARDIGRRCPLPP